MPDEVVYRMIVEDETSTATSGAAGKRGPAGQAPTRDDITKKLPKGMQAGLEKLGFGKFLKMAGWIGLLVGGISFITQLLKKSKIFSSYMNAFLETLSAFVDVMLIPLIPLFSEVLKRLLEWFVIFKKEGWGELLKKIFMDVNWAMLFPGFGSAIEMLKELFTVDWKNAIENIKNWWDKLIVNVGTWWRDVVNFVVGLWNGAVEGVKNGWNWVVTNVSNLWTSAINNIENWWGILINTVSAWWTTIGNFALSVWGTVKDSFISHVIDPIVSWWQSVFGGGTTSVARSGGEGETSTSKLGVTGPWTPISPSTSRLPAPFLQTGTPFVPSNMLAFLHRGEAVIPASRNNAFGRSAGGISINNIISVGSDAVGSEAFNFAVRASDEMEKQIEKIVRRIG